MEKINIVKLAEALATKLGLKLNKTDPNATAVKIQAEKAVGMAFGHIGGSFNRAAKCAAKSTRQIIDGFISGVREGFEEEMSKSKS